MVKPSDILAIVHQAQLVRRKVEDEWLENVRFLGGQFGSTTEYPDMDRVDVNMAWANMMAIVPTLYWKDPTVTGAAIRPQDETNVSVVTAGIQHALKLMDTQRVVHRLIVDAHVFPFGVGKLGYRVTDEQVAVKISKKTGAVEVVDESDNIDLSEFDLEQRQIRVGNCPLLKRVSPFSCWVDPLASDWEESEWLCEAVTRHVDDVKGDPKYKNVSRLKPTGAVEELFSVQQRTEGLRRQPLPEGAVLMDSIGAPATIRDDQVVLWEFWDKRERKLYVLAPYQESGLLLREENWPYPFFPYRALHLGVASPDSPYPIPPNSVWKPQQKELNKIRTYELDHIKRAISKYLIDASKMSQQAQDELREGIMQAIAIDGDPTGVVTSVPGAPMNPDVWRAEATVKTDIQQITGIADFQRAIGMQAGTTATEIRAIEAGMAARVAYQRSQVGLFIRWVARGTYQLMRIYWGSDDWVRVTGRSNWEYRKLSPEILAGEYDIEIEVGSHVPVDPDVDKKRALDLFQILAPIAIQRPDLVSVEELVRYLMEKMEVPDPDRFLRQNDTSRPPSDPSMEETLLSEGGMPTFSVNDDHPRHILIHTQGAASSINEQDRWRRLRHLKQHLDYVDAQQVAQSGPLPELGGMGRIPPGAGYPISPRLMAEQPPDVTKVLRANAKRVSPR